MRIVIALGGNALLRRSDPMTTEVQRRNVKIAAEAIAPLAAEHSIVVVHGNGPQVGLLALQADAYQGAEPYPLDVLDAGTQGMIGYLIQQELRSLLPPEHQVATLLTMIVVDPADPAFASPTKFVGPVYAQEAADALAADKGWTFRQDGDAWRRVVPSPDPGASWRSSRSPGCSSGGPWSSARAAGGSPRRTRPRDLAKWWASKRSSTRISRANCWPRTWARTCSSWRPTWTASARLGTPEARRLGRGDAAGTSGL